MDDSRAAHEELLRRCAAREPDAFEALYEQTSSMLYAIALRMLRQPAAAEDVVQEAYLSIWSRAADYRPGARRAADVDDEHHPLPRARRAQRRRSHREDAQQPLDEEAHADPFGGDAEARTDDARMLDACLERLADEQRSCIVLSYCEGYTHQELAERFSRPEGTVKSWIRRGVQALKGCLDGGDDS